MSFRKTTFPISLMNLFVVLGLRFTFNNSSNSLLTQGLNSSMLITNQLNVTSVETDIEPLCSYLKPSSFHSSHPHPRGKVNYSFLLRFRSLVSYEWSHKHLWENTYCSIIMRKFLDGNSSLSGQLTCVYYHLEYL